ncbi:MAG: preprotein translocase subunit SecG [Alphaproteobacteria bacterium]|jgi:preprotein translocase subunit SecG|nr:preprotein translocase subunit SecG [Alphaproteobacteria bacterium]MBT5827263.1 preprotein translocase subunit SecG [Alphaproteobacteria bacterium]
MESLQTISLIVHILVAIFIVIFVLLQPSGGGDGLVSSYTPTGNFMSARSAANFLSKATMILAIIFMANTLFLGVIANKKSQGNSIVEDLLEEEKKNQIPLAE